MPHFKRWLALPLCLVAMPGFAAGGPDLSYNFV